MVYTRSFAVILFMCLLSPIFAGDEIHNLVRDGKTDAVRLILEKDPRLVNLRDQDGATPLHSACYEGHKEIVSLLLSKGADVNATDTNGSTPLIWAGHQGHADVAKILVANGADINVLDKAGRTALHTGAVRGHTHFVELLLAKGADVMSYGAESASVLSHAVAAGHREIAEMLIAEGADVNAYDHFGYSPLRIAVFRDNTEMVSMLIERGAVVNGANDKGEAALHEASLDGRVDVAKILIQGGADVNLKTKEGIAPLHFAANHGHREMAAFLIDRGAEVNQVTKVKDTPLHGAAWYGDIETVRLLISHGGRINVENGKGETPLANAFRLGHTDIVELLKSKGAHTTSPVSKRQPLVGLEDKQDTGIASPVTFTILYDNYVYRKGTESDWGFSCLIQGTEKTILFDTGTKPDILMHNVKQLEVDLKPIEQIVISHNHHDHTGGLFTILDQHSTVTVFLPISFPYEFVRKVEAKKANVKCVDKPEMICKHVYLTGEMGDTIKEQSLIVNTKNGTIVVTGCSHQGIVKILERAKALLDKPIALVFGGFHLGGKSAEELRAIIRDFKKWGVQRCGATHCTGEKAIAMFKEAFGDNYVPMGTGRVFQIPEKSN